MRWTVLLPLLLVRGQQEEEAEKEPTTPVVEGSGTSPAASETIIASTLPTPALFEPEVGTTEPKNWKVKYQTGNLSAVPSEGMGTEEEEKPDTAASTQDKGSSTDDDDGVEVQWEDGEVEVVKAASLGPFKCYDCLSAVDPKCSDEKWDEKYADKHFAKVCAAHRPSTMPDAPVVGCRKTYTSIPSASGWRVERQCAYSGPSDVQGEKRAGSEGVIRYIYQCSSHECNSAMRALPHFAFVFFLSLLSAVFSSSL